MKKEKLRNWIYSILNSYAQIFFSLNKVLAVIILLVTFIDPFLGLCGLVAIIVANLLSIIVGLNKEAVTEGIYGFNALLLGMSLGFEYRFNLAFTIVFISAIFLLIINTIWLSTVLGKYKLPFLGLPFLITYWLINLAAGSFTLIELQEQYVYVENLYASASESMVYVFAHSLDKIPLPTLLMTYFKTLSATFFQNSVLAGITISLGLLYFSRIAFTLSLIGFFTAYYLFEILGIPTILLTEYLVGSNFIFFAIAIGGFYLIPSKGSYLSVILLIPVLSVFLISIGKIMMVFQLKSFTLSFSVLTILFLFFVKHRWFQKYVHLVSIQYYSAEITLYKHLSTTRRFKNAHLAKITLPFWGEWQVSQGYNGNITHLGDFGNALDFVIVNEEKNTYALPGGHCNDFYCYDKPVVAPFDGNIIEIVNTIEDNLINKVNTEHNWGNTIIIDHQNGLYSQLSHLKKDSFKVKISDFVKRGDLLATCGNSGRSPEPHLHFQLQLSPKVGAITYPYPISYYLKNEGGEFELKTFEVPKENETISNIIINPTLGSSYDFSPGKNLRMQYENQTWDWKVFTDEWNRTYFSCPISKSKLWFVNDRISFYCYDFEGSRNSLLHQFYLANYKILLASYVQLRVKDDFPLDTLVSKPVLWFQDFIAPIYSLLNTNYVSFTNEIDSQIAPKKISVSSEVTAHIFNKQVSKIEYKMKFENDKLINFIIVNQGKSTTYTCDIF